MPEAAIVERRSPPSWLVPLAVVALVATASAWLDPWSAALAGDQKALFYDRLAVGSAGSVTIAAGHFLIWAVLVILLKPMLSIALIVAVELWLAPEDSEKKNRPLVWAVQGVFL